MRARNKRKIENYLGILIANDSTIFAHKSLNHTMNIFMHLNSFKTFAVARQISLAIALLVTSITAHSQYIAQSISEDEYEGLGNELSIHPSGKKVYSHNGMDNKLVLLDINQSSGALTYSRTIECIGEMIVSISFAQEGNMMLVETFLPNSMSGLSIYSLDEQGNPQLVRNLEFDAKEDPNLIALHPSGEYLFTLTTEKLTKRGPGFVRAYQLDNELKLIQEIELEDGFMSYMAFGSQFTLSPDGSNLFLYTGDRGILKAYDILPDGKFKLNSELQLINSENDTELVGLLFDPSGQVIYACNSQAIKVLKPSKKGVWKSAKTYNYSCYSVAINKEGSELIVLWEDDDYFQFYTTYKLDGQGMLSDAYQFQLTENQYISDIHYSPVNDVLYFADDSSLLMIE